MPESPLLMALRKIADLDNCTQIRGGFYDIGVPDHKMADGGWVPIPPQVLAGLRYAARIAKDAIENAESVALAERSAVQHLYDGMLQHDAEINDERGDGTKARVPTCDDYNVLFDMVLDCAVACGIHDPTPKG